MKRPGPGHAVLLLFCGLTAGCDGEEARSLEVRLLTASVQALNPFLSAPDLRRVRVFVQGTEQHDDAIFDVDPTGDQRRVTFDGLVSLEVSVGIEGFDGAGAVVAFGRSGVVDLSSNSAVDVPFRRNLAYVTHEPNDDQDQPARWIYAIDLATRALVDRIQIPGNAPVARSITAQGGEAMIVTWQDGSAGYSGLLSLDDHALDGGVELPAIQDTTLGVPGTSLGVALGRGQVSLVDFQAGTSDRLSRVGGRVLDAVIGGDGRRALVAVGSPSALLLVDLERQTVEGQNVIPDPSGVALDAAGRLAFVTSSSSPRVVAFDLANKQANVLTGGGFAAPVDLAVYSESLQAVLGVNRDQTIGRILAYSIAAEQGTPLDGAVETLENPAAIAADGTGRRFVVVSAGSSTASAGLTIVDSSANELRGSGRLYLGDPEDTVLLPSGAPNQPPVIVRQRYQPRSVAIVYGR